MIVENIFLLQFHMYYWCILHLSCIIEEYDNWTKIAACVQPSMKKNRSSILCSSAIKQLKSVLFQVRFPIMLLKLCLVCHDNISCLPFLPSKFSCWIRQWFHWCPYCFSVHHFSMQNTPISCIAWHLALEEGHFKPN